MWTPEQVELELLDWETKPDDFDRLVKHVTDKLILELKPKGIELSSIVSETELRDEIWIGAKSFEEKHVSLPLHVYLYIKSFLICKRKGEKWR
jgi:hypothetical protein